MNFSFLCGFHLEKGTNPANDIHIFPKVDNPVLGKEYLKGAPKIAIEIDTTRFALAF